MKTKKRNTKRIIAGILAFVLIGFILLTANGFVGNPISKMLANRQAAKYVDENYSDLDLEVEDAYYEFKNGNYIVQAKSNKSEDTYFDMSFTPSGKLFYDDYEEAVLKGWNTRTRIDDEYRALTDRVFEDSFPYEINSHFALLFTDREDYSYLELDKIYDIKELGKKEGKIILEIQREDIDTDLAAKVLLDTKKAFDEKDVTFNLIDLNIEKPIEVNDKYQAGLMIRDFKYEDIYPENLEERVEENIKESNELNKEEDKKKEEEIDEFNEDIKDKD